MGHITSGNYTVDSMGSMNISGNIIPMIWYKTITRTNGKPHLLAITLLSDIVYWYRPSEVRDERSGQVVGWQKRFKGDLLQKTYQQYADLFGESRRSIKAAFDVLESLEVIKRRFRDVSYENGMMVYNLMYIELDADILYALTYPERIPEPGDEEQDYIEENNTFPDGELEEKIDNIGGTEKCTTYPQKNVGGGTKFCTTPLQNDVLPPTTNRKYTKNTTKSTTEIDNIHPIHQDNDSDVHIRQDKGSVLPEGTDVMTVIDRYRQVVKKNIEYEYLKLDMTNHGAADRLDEILELIVETISTEKESIRIGCNALPFSQAKSKFLKLNNAHIRYVLHCLAENTSHIKNVRSYLLTTLYNAPDTINHYYQAKVNHDMYEEPEWNDDG